MHALLVLGHRRSTPRCCRLTTGTCARLRSSRDGRRPRDQRLRGERTPPERRPSAGITAIDWTPSDTAPVHPEAGRRWTPSTTSSATSESGSTCRTPARSSTCRALRPAPARVGSIARATIAPVPGEPDAINEATSPLTDARIVRRGDARRNGSKTSPRGTRTRIVSELLTCHAGWLPGDDRIVVSSNQDGDWDLYTVSAEGGGELTPLLEKAYTQHPIAVAPDGSVVYSENDPGTGGDLWVLAPDGRDACARRRTPFIETSAQRLARRPMVAYHSNESGRVEVYAVPFSGAGDRVTGLDRRRRADRPGRRDGKRTVLSRRRRPDERRRFDVDAAALRLGTPKKLLATCPAFEPSYFHDFDVSPDGQRFLLHPRRAGRRPRRVDVDPELVPGAAARAR